MVPVHAGDIIAGVVGSRQALRGYAGRIQKIEKGDILHLLNLGGVIGECTSINPEVGEPCHVEVLGAVVTFTELGPKESPPVSFLGQLRWWIRFPLRCHQPSLSRELAQVLVRPARPVV